ncbi:hypothetical protein [Vibrio phage D4]|nr:hypothetical protein [Vibrio phage D4]
MFAAQQLIEAELNKLREKRKQLNALAGQTQSNEIRKAYVQSADALLQPIQELANAERIIDLAGHIVRSNIPLKPMLREATNAIFPDWQEGSQLSTKEATTKHLLDIGHVCVLSREGKTVDFGVNLMLKDWVKARSEECRKAEDAACIAPDPVDEAALIPNAEEVETEEDRIFQQKANETHAQFLDDEVFEQKRDQDL